eukprot:258421-Prymnesium_polylepis.1
MKVRGLAIEDRSRGVDRIAPYRTVESKRDFVEYKAAAQEPAAVDGTEEARVAAERACLPADAATV